MKKISTLLAIVLMSFQTANALIVSIDGEGEIPEEGMELTISDAEEDPLSGEPVMELKGNLLATSQLTVQITRSEEGVTDEFCCGDKCTSGNSATEETLLFDVTGQANWYIHYTPKEKSDVTIEYLFSEGTETLKLKVRYRYGVNDDPVFVEKTFPKKHLIEEFTGQDCIYCPGGMDAISEFMENDTNYVLVLHHAGYKDDHFTVTGSKTIASKLSVSGAPSSTIDRAKTQYVDQNKQTTNAVVLHPGYLPDVDKSQYATETYASLNIENKYNADSSKLNVHISGEIGKEDYSSLGLKLTVLVKESGMIDYQKDYYTFEGWEEFRHANAVRVFLTSATGDAVTIDSTRHYSADLSVSLNSQWVAENCMVVAFLSQSFQPVVQAAEKPVVEGSAGGADIEHGGIKTVAVPDYYPEPNATSGPSTYSKQDEEVMSTILYQGYDSYPAYGFNYWTIQMVNTSRTVTVNRTICYPFVILHLFTELNQKSIPDGVYEFNTSEQPGTAYAGFRNDEDAYIGGSSFYFTSRAYYNQGYLDPQAQWLIAGGTLTKSGDCWIINGKTLNGSDIHIRYGSPQGIDDVSGAAPMSKKYMENGRLVIRTAEGQTFDTTGKRIE
ncbi:MAG: Omp28-related outer membrane protein [Paludibacteraceae bacterium]|nr:Omp28-related outer membrane protein [Paludibacteraceae bacterium]